MNNYSQSANPNATNSELDAKKIVTKSQYELFQEWLNDCPVQIESYQDNVDSVYIRFDVETSEVN